MAQGWHGDSTGHARAGRIGGKKSAETRRNNSDKFGEKIEAEKKSEKAAKTRSLD